MYRNGSTIWPLNEHLATVGFLFGKVKCKMNKTLEWLDYKAPKEKYKLIKFVFVDA